MEERAKIPVTLPRPNPTTSYWQDPPDEIADLQSTEHLPEYVDYIIVGSGISGASIAYNLLKKKPGSSILMLEARQACSGATGRNGKSAMMSNMPKNVLTTKTNLRWSHKSSKLSKFPRP